MTAHYQRKHRAYLKSITPTEPFVSRSSCPGCIALKAADWANRFPVGFCSSACWGRRIRLEKSA